MKETTAVSDYLKSLRSIPLLKHDELVELFKVYENGGEAGAKAKEKLIVSNLRLVVSMATAFNKQKTVPIEDLIQEGNIGLLKAVEKYDYKKGFKFSTYARWWIRQQIGQHLLNKRRMIRLPSHAASAQRKMVQAIEDYKTQFDCEPSTEELTEMCGASETVVKATMYLQSGKNIVSLTQPLYKNRDATIGDTIVDESSSPLESYENKQLLNVTKSVLKKLPRKEMAIIRLRFGLTENPADHTENPITEEEYESVSNGFGMRDSD